MDTPKETKIKKIHKFIHILVATLIIAGGCVIMKKLIDSKKNPEKKEVPYLAPLVSTQQAVVEDVQINVTGFGTVRPKILVQIVPQVAGVVVKCRDDFVDGGFFDAKQPLITIDQRDYKAAVNNAEAAVARAKVTLNRELEEAAIARTEWQQLNPGKEPTSSLVFRQPQIEQAKAELKAAQASLDTAKVNLDRTIISMPFNGRIAEESVDIGQYVTPGKSIATVYGTDAVEIIVPLEDKDLAWFNVPDGQSSTESGNNINGSSVDVTAEFGGKNWAWIGKVVRTQGRIDPVTRMINVVIEVEKPFEKVGDRPPLTPGMFVNIEIKGKILKDVIRLPRYVVRNADQAWTAKNGKLIINTIEITRNDSEYSYVTSGIENGDIIVTSPIDAVTNGMAIRTETDETKNQETDSNGK